MSSIDFLLASQNPDGGWGYKRGGMSFVEPTASVLLALHCEQVAAAARARALGFLVELQRADGGWPIAAPDTESGWMTAWAVWALSGGEPSDRAVLARGVDWLLATRGLTYTDPSDRARLREIYGMDSALTGWPWQPGDASWVFPTGLALVALAAAGQDRNSRVEEGLEFLVDREVENGGWNIGNHVMVGQFLPPAIQTTAIALQALVAWRGPTDPSLAPGRAVLERDLVAAPASADLGWGAWTCRLLGRDATRTYGRLAGMMRSDGSWGGNPFHTALALLAIGSRTP